MKSKLSTLLVCLLLASSMAMGQSKTTIKLNPLSLGVLTINLQGEHAFGERISAQLGFFYGGLKLGGGISGLASAKMAYNWLGITPEVRYYVYTPDEAPNGLYIAPFFRFQRVKAEFDVTYSYFDSNTNSTVYDEGHAILRLPAIGGGAVVGYQWIIGEHFVWDSYIGPSYYAGNVQAEVDFPETADYTLPELRSGFSGFTIRFGTSIGVAF